MKTVFRVIIGIVFSSLFGHVVVAEEITLRVVSLEERLETLRAGIKEGGKLACGDTRHPIMVPYDSCARLHSLYGHGCYGYSTADMVNAMTYGRICDEVELLQKARSPSVEYFNVGSSDWWKSIPASIAPHLGDLTLEGVFDPDLSERRNATQNLLQEKVLGDFEIAKVFSRRNGIVLILDEWTNETGCGHQDKYTIYAPVLVDLDGDGVAELRFYALRTDPLSLHCGSMDSLDPGYVVVLKKTSPDGVIREME